MNRAQRSHWPDRTSDAPCPLHAPPQPQHSVMNTLCSQVPGERSPAGQQKVYPSLHMKVSPKTQGTCPDGPGVPTKQASRDTCSRTWWQHATPSSSGWGAQHSVEPLQIGDSNAAEGRAVKTGLERPTRCKVTKALGERGWGAHRACTGPRHPPACFPRAPEHGLQATAPARLAGRTR